MTAYEVTFAPETALSDIERIETLCLGFRHVPECRHRRDNVRPVLDTTAAEMRAKLMAIPPAVTRAVYERRTPATWTPRDGWGELMFGQATDPGPSPMRRFGDLIPAPALTRPTRGRRQTRSMAQDGLAGPARSLSLPLDGATRPRSRARPLPPRCRRPRSADRKDRYRPRCDRPRPRPAPGADPRCGSLNRDIWNRVHNILKPSPRKRAARTRVETPALLKGQRFGPDGGASSPSHTRKGEMLYRYAVSWLGGE